MPTRLPFKKTIDSTASATPCSSSKPYLITLATILLVFTSAIDAAYRPRSGLTDLYPPDISTDGFMEMRWSGKNYSPKQGAAFESVINDPLFKELPKEALLGDPRLDLRYRINLEGKINDKLSIFYDIEQEPDFPEKFDIRIKYDTSELTFGDFDAEFKNGEFINVDKSFKGIKFTTEQPDWQAQVVQAQEKSKQKKIERFGNGREEVSLGNQFILENSVRVWVNNAPQNEGVDYTVDYFDGIIKFNRPITQEETIRIVYEYTNPVEDFIPSLSRKSFTGLDYKWNPKAPKKPKRILQTHTESITNIKPETEIKLPHSPIVLGSTQITHNGIPLRKDKDYVVKNNRGTIYFPGDNISTTDNITIQYESHKQKIVTENIQATNSPGPYLLKNKNPLLGSLEVAIDGTPAKEGRDYIIDSKRGSLLFNYNLDSSKEISTTYNTYELSNIKPIAENPTQIGVTYMNESVKQQDDTIDVADESPTLSTNTITTKFNPINPSANITVKLNGTPTTLPYTLNAYQGQLIFSPSDYAILQGGNVTIDYSYKKSNTTEYTFFGDGNNEYTNTIQFFLKDVPVKYQGIEYITLWGGPFKSETRLSNGVEFRVDYGDNGQEVKIIFLKASDNPESTLLDYPGPDTRIKVKYLYTPDITADPGDITQRIVGITGQTEVAENWLVSSEFVHSEHNFSKPSLPGSTLLTGNNSQQYQLGNQNLVENSELVTVKSTNRILTKDIDYFINYQNGKITFINLTPTPQDQIQVDYDYFSAGIATAGQTVDGNAVKLKTAYKTGDLTLSSDIKNLDRSFLPIGDIQEDPGTLSYGANALWERSKDETTMADFRSKSVFKSLNNQSREINLDQTDLRLKTNHNYFDNLLKTNHEAFFRNETQKSDDDLSYDIDQYTTEYKGGLTFGPKHFQTETGVKLSNTNEDYIDNSAPTLKESYQTYLRGNIEPPDIMVLNKVRFRPFTTQTTQTTKTKTPSTPFVTTSFDNIQSIGAETDIIPHDTFKNTVRLAWTDIDTLTTTGFRSQQDIFNSKFTTQYTPTPWFKSSASYEHEEKESPLLSQSGGTRDKTTFNIRKFMPYGAAESLGDPGYLFWLSPTRGSYMSYNTSDSIAKENNNRITNKTNYNNFRYSDFEPIKGITFTSVGISNTFANLDDKAGNTAVSRNISSTNSDRQFANINIKPQIEELKQFEYDLKVSEKNDSRFSLRDTATTANITQKSLPEDIRYQKLSYTTDELNIGSINLKKFSSSLEESWSRKHDLTENIASGNVTKSKTTETFVNNADIRKVTHKSAFSPMKDLNMGTKIAFGEEYYNRNLFVTTVGSLGRNTEDQLIDAIYIPSDQWTYETDLEHNTLKQLASPSINVPFGQLASDPSNTTLKSAQWRWKGLATYTPISWVSIKGGTEQIALDTSAKSPTLNVTDHFHQSILIYGAIVRPYENLEIEYTLYNKNTAQSGAARGVTATAATTKINYIPIKTDTYSVFAKYERTTTNGEDLNTLQQDLQLQRSNENIRWQIVDRNDTVETAKLGIDINIPFPSSKYIDKMVITGEGVLKKITDNRNPDNNFDISGLLIKASLIL